MGALLAWALIALIAPVLPSADVLPEAVFVVALAAVLTYVPGRFWPASEARLEQVAWAAALVGVAGGLIRVPTLVSGYRTTPESAAWMTAAQATLAVATLVLAPPVYRYLSSRTATGVMTIGFLAATMLCGALIVGVPDPQIDLFYVLNDGPRQLLGGHNPYTVTYQLATPQSFGYLPGMLLLSLPVVAIGDIRWVLLPMVPLAAICLRGLARSAGASKLRADLVALAFLTYPGLPWIVREAFVEPPIVAAFLGGLWAVIAGHSVWAIAAAVAFLTIKQYTAPLLLPLWAAGLGARRVALAVLVALAITLPFVIWSPADFWWDTVGNLVNLPPRPDATSFNGYLLARFDAHLPSWLVVTPPLCATAYRLWQAWRGADWRTVLRLTAGSYFLLFLFNKFAFANYYFLLQAMLLASGGVTCARSLTVKEQVHERR